MKKIWLKIKSGWRWFIGLFVTSAVALTVANFAGFPPDVSKYELAKNCIASPQQINKCIGELNVNEKASIKGIEIAKIKSPRIKKGDVDIEIVDIKNTENKLEVFARAWDSNGQIGFGDGSVDIERFVFFTDGGGNYGNLRWLVVADPFGDILVDYIDLDGNPYTVKYREDPKEVILREVSDAVRVSKKHGADKIVFGKIGNTILTAHPQPSTGTAPIDGTPQVFGVNQTFPNIRANSGVAGGINNTAAINTVTKLRSSSTTDQFNYMDRPGFGFNTSSIGTDVIDSATFSLAGTGTAEETTLDDTDIDLTSFTPADGSLFAYTDYAVANYGSTRLATGLAVSTWNQTDGTYNNWTLNASGIASINKSGNTYFSTRLKWDFDNSFTGTWSFAGDGNSTSAVTYFADQADVTKDPKLVVNHTESAGEAATDDAIIWEE